MEPMDLNNDSTKIARGEIKIFFLVFTISKKKKKNLKKPYVKVHKIFLCFKGYFEFFFCCEFYSDIYSAGVEFLNNSKKCRI